MHRKVQDAESAERLYLSDGLGHPEEAAGLGEAHGRVQADLVAHRHVHRLGALIAAPQSLKNRRLWLHPSDTRKEAFSGAQPDETLGSCAAALVPHLSQHFA